VNFAASYRGLSGQAVNAPRDTSCGGMSPCSGTTDANGQVSSALVTTMCDSTVTVTATVNSTNQYNGASGQSQAALPPCGGQEAASVGLPFTSPTPPSPDHRVAEGLIGAGLLAGIGGALALIAGRQRRPAVRA
jgi:hypothetical protein